MKKLARVAGLGLLVWASPRNASAHFVLNQPVDALKTNSTGDPEGGTQKTAPCGEGTGPTGVVTKVKAGGKLHVKLTEAVVHPGHYRIAITSKPEELVDPEFTKKNGQCDTATIQSPVVAPIVADGVFVHKGDIEQDTVWETDITVPTETCENCTLQVIQFMSAHVPGCYYHHCANIQIVDEDVPDGGVTLGGSDASTPISTGTGSGTTSSGNATTDHDHAGATSGSTTPASSNDDSGGCRTSPNANLTSGAMLGLAVALAASMRRRRQR